MSENNTNKNAIKLVGEVFIPGASLLMDGKILAGGAHFVAGTLAKIALGPIALFAVIANSYSTSTTGKNLIKQFSSIKDEIKPKDEIEPKDEIKPKDEGGLEGQAQAT